MDLISTLRYEAKRRAEANAANAEFVGRHVDALTRRDLDEVMDHYRDDSRLRTGHEEFVGTEAIRSHLEEQLASAPEHIHLEYEVSTDPDAWVRFVWTVLDQPGGSPVMSGFDRFLVGDGVIREQEVSVDEV